MKLIYLTNGNVTQISDEDHIYLAGWDWHQTTQGHVQRQEKGRKILMHREVRRFLGFPPELEVDHKDRDKLNNQRYNLRPATHSQNIANAKLQANNKSGHRGVWWDSVRKKYLVRVAHSYVGYFEDREVAIEAYKAKAKEMFGEFASSDTIG